MMKRWWWWSFIWFIHLIKWIYFNSWVHCSATVCMCCHLELNYVLFYYSLLFIHRVAKGLQQTWSHHWMVHILLYNTCGARNTATWMFLCSSLNCYISTYYNTICEGKQFISSGLQRRVDRVLLECANHASHLVWAGLPLTVWETLPKTLFGL